ncbi:hypothetical protein, conserved [Trypanosoma brucei gambiense DAL972]|uniref:DDRGK domain-containing protein 1 n=1 Tax=Trypanosoma brucei gambiense (strain MHOM/CI/86/DAL972) TaxID=679716 RepID=D0A242_TRYB9|nr:hypothetical protein, conserved [Trypanosoma brucei gambiense DAL972]CBH15335.1 hypothetical protein, conserved [Trypanosoma brucei gambiense DAL972]|eukprot:XP_011777600.1 hypothetical protein, conserved [Trypanosoma brucei gambiense DAL972]
MLLIVFVVGFLLLLTAFVALQLRRSQQFPTFIDATPSRVAARRSETRRSQYNDGDYWSNESSDEGSDDDDNDNCEVGHKREERRMLRGGTSGSAGPLRHRRTRRGAGNAAEANGDGEEDKNGSQTKLSRLQRKKQEKERERQERQQAQEALLENRRVKQEEEQRQQKDREREEREREIAEEAALQELREEKKRQEDEEYAKWVEGIGVVERGEIGDEERKKHDNLVKYLITMPGNGGERQQQRVIDAENFGEGKKVGDETITRGTESSSRGNILILNDVARMHGLSVEVTVQVIEKLLEDGVISGVFDDRGKFVMLSEEHYKQIAEFVKLRGRVSMKELARECNRIIML